MARIKFTKGAETFTFETDRRHPVHDPTRVNVVTDMSDGGQLYAYDKGIQEQLFNLVFDKATLADFTNFDNWLTTVAKGPLNTFTFTDEDQVDHTVRLLNTENPFKRVKQGTYAGTIRLRKEI
jgi:hypothetical protein